MSAPSVPNIQLHAWAGPNSITFYWAPPTSIGSSPITNYTLLCSSIPYSTVLSPSTYNVQISSLTNNVDYIFQIAASNSNGISPYMPFNIAQAGLPPGGATSVTVSTTDVSTVLVNWSYSTNANEAKAQFFGISILPSTGSTSTNIAVAYANQRTSRITNLSTNHYTFLVQAITNAGWALPYSYSFSPMTFVGNAVVLSQPQGTFTPLSIPGLQLWFDGGDVTSMTFSGSNITQWNDKSGNGYNTNAVTGTPTFTSGTGIIFNGSSYFNLPNGAIPFNNTSYSIFFVATFPNTGGNYGIISGGLASNNQSLNVRSGSGGVISTYWYNNDIVTVATFTANTKVLYGSLFQTGGQRNVYLAATLTTTNTPSANRAQPNTNNKIGITVANEVMSGSISEILVFNNSLSATNRQIVEGYLAWKWGIQSNLPNNHPYYINPVTLIMPTLLVYLYATTYSGSGTWNDSSPNGKNATLENGSISKNAVGNGIVLNGSTSWTFPNVAAGNSWSFSVWYKNTGLLTGSPARMIFTQKWPGSGSINMCLGDSSGAYTGVTNAGFYNTAWRTGTQFTYTNNVWTNTQVTWNGTSLTTYTNGTLTGTTTPGGTSIDNNSQAYRIGNRFDSQAAYVTGEFGEIRIYNAPLSTAQVLNLYNTTASSYAS